MSFNGKKGIAILAALLITASLAGCGGESAVTSSESAVSADVSTAASDDVTDDEMFTDRDKEVGYDESEAVSIALSDDGITCDSDLVTVDGSTVTISGEGTFLLSGTLTDGQIIVDAAKTDKLQLVLDNVDINCNTSAPLYVRQADKVFVTLAAGSDNKLTNQEDFVAIDDNNIDSVIFSKDDLTLNGSGSLTVEAQYGHGIVSKDDLVITGGTYTITSPGHALSGKDSIRVADGTFTLTTGKDGLHSENKDDSSLGFIYVAGGTFNIESDGDGMDAATDLTILGGTITVKSGGGSENGEEKTSSDDMGRGGFRQWKESTTDTDTSEDTVSTKGLKAGSTLRIDDGTLTVDSADDTIHSNGTVTVSGGNLTLTSGDDGIHGDDDVTISGGSISVTECYEGIEGQTVTISGGTISVVASDDGINAAGGNDQSGFGGKMQTPDTFGSSDSSTITISGGTIHINADGDGIDSNGSLYVTGGEVYVSGPTDSGNGAIDYDGSSEITGGIVVAVGDGTMAQNFGSTSTQGSMLVSVSGSAGDEIVLKDSSGTTLVSYQPEKSFTSVVISSPQIKEGETYTLSVGDDETEITMTDLIYGSNGSMGGFGGGMGGNFGGGQGDGKQEKPSGEMPNGDQMELPDGETPTAPPTGDGETV